MLAITSTAQRPDLVPVVATWLWDAFGRHDGRALDDVQARVAAAAAASGPEQTWVLLADRVPVGTASLAVEDLDERRDLTPWLAGVYVVPAVRGRGYAAHLITAVEQAARASGVPVLWLYTHTAERVYLRAGWTVAERVDRGNKPMVAVMRRELNAPGGC